MTGEMNMKSTVKTAVLAMFLCIVLLMSACGVKVKTTETSAAEAETEAATEAKAADTTSAEPEAKETSAEVTEVSDETVKEDASWTAVETKGKIIMGLDDNFPPMGFRDEKDEIVGFDVDLAKEVAKRLGIELELLPIDWKMKQNELDAGNIDMLWNGYSYTEERAKDNTLSAPYLENDQVVVVMAKSGIKDLDGLADKTLALQEESSAEQALDAAADFKASLKDIVPFRDNVTAFLDLETGHSDGLLIDKVVGEYYIAQKNIDDYVILDESLAPETYVIGFRKGEVALKDKIEETLRAMKEDGTLAKIATAWFGSDVTIFK
jgi:polar amino acid transport system substrate-binding protein